MAGLSRDLRYAARALMRAPVFTLVAATALAVGIGANLAIFGFVNAMLLRPLGAADPDRLIRADLGGPDTIENAVPYSDYTAYRDRAQTLSQLTLFHQGGLFNVRLPPQPPAAIHVMPVTGNYFETLGVQAAIGRAFVAADDVPGAPGVVVLSDEGWRRHFDADPGVVGRAVAVNGTPFTVVGVLPAAFEGTLSPVHPQIYATWHAVWADAPLPLRGMIVGRLQDDASRAQAQADLSRIAAQLRAEGNASASIAVYPATTYMPGTGRAFGAFGALFMVIVGAVLWGACSNVAILQLVRSMARRREMAIRLAIGASRIQAVRHIVVESLLLAALAGAGAVALALAAARLLTQIQLPVPMPIALTFDVDWRVVTFAAGVAILSALASAFHAVIEAWRTDVTGSLLHDSPPIVRSRRHRNLVITQVAISTCLLLVAAALVRSLSVPQSRGLDATGVMMATITLPANDYPRAQRRLFHERLLQRLEAEPDVTVASIVETVPLANNRPYSRATVGNRQVLVNHVSRGHFATLGIPLLEGRDFRDRDDDRSPAVAIVNQTLARRLWPDGAALGRRLDAGSMGSLEVVGVARDSKYQRLDEQPQAMLYRPLAQAAGEGQGVFFVKTRADASRTAALVRAAVAAIDPDLAAFNLNTLEARLALARLPNRAAATLSGLLGLIALGLGTIGTYSVMAAIVDRRRREIGVRIALGAMPSMVMHMIARQGLVWTAAGLLGGLAAGSLILAALQRVVYGVSAIEPAAMIAVALLLAVTSGLACYVPARQACRRDPVSVLRA